MNIIKILGFVTITIGIILSTYLFSISYTDFIFEVSNIVNVAGEENKLQKVLDKKAFLTIKFLSFIPSILGFIIILFSKPILYYSKFLTSIFFGIVEDIKTTKKKYLLIISIIILVNFLYRLHYATIYPVIYDEAWTFINYTSKGILSSISYYHSANNHILNSVLTNFSSILPFGQTVNLRIPSIFTGILSIFIFYLVFSKIYNSKVSLYVTLIFSFLYPVFFYGYTARGYSLIMLAFIISFYGSLRLLEPTEVGKNRQQYWIYLSLGSVVGLYSIPSFLYPYFSLTTFLALNFLYYRNFKDLINLLISICVTAVTTIVLYLPIFIISGLEALTNKGDVQTLPGNIVVENMYQHFVDTMRFMFFSEWVFLLIFFVGAFAFLKKRKDYKVNLAIYIVLISPLLVLAHSFIPPARSWIYLIVPILFLLGWFVNFIFSKKGSIVLSISLILTTIILFFSYDNYIRDRSRAIGNSTLFALEANKLSQFLISKKAKKIYVNHPLIETNIIYAYNEKAIPLNLVYSRESLLNDKNLTENSFDFLVVNKKFDRIKNYIFLKKMCVSCSINGEKTYVYVSE